MSVVAPAADGALGKMISLIEEVKAAGAQRSWPWPLRGLGHPGCRGRRHHGPAHGSAAGPCCRDRPPQLLAHYAGARARLRH